MLVRKCLQYVSAVIGTLNRSFAVPFHHSRLAAPWILAHGHGSVWNMLLAHHLRRLPDLPIQSYFPQVASSTLLHAIVRPLTVKTSCAVWTDPWELVRESSISLPSLVICIDQIPQYLTAKYPTHALFRNYHSRWHLCVLGLMSAVRRRTWLL